MSDRRGPDRLQAAGWRLEGWASRRIVAGTTDRHSDPKSLLHTLGSVQGTVEAGQVHGGSVAVIARSAKIPEPIAGCDALMTRLPSIALLVRSADCLPILFADPRRDVVALAHVGWRGCLSGLPARVVAAFRHTFHTAPSELHVAIGPAIRACCYEVGAEFDEPFAPFVQRRENRRTCDLVGFAAAQLARCGVSLARIADSGRCTACEPTHWFSLRREGSSTGRLASFIMLRP